MSPLLIPILGVSIPIIAILAGVFTKWMKLKERQLELQSTMTAEKTAQYAAHTERLEQRVRVLERVITDRGVGVAEEIEALRDTPSRTLPIHDRA
jgi:ABC-type phosphate transport system auxiliary subunit